METTVKEKPSFAKWLILFVFGFVIASFFYFDLSQFLSLTSLKENKEALQNYTQSHYLLVVGLYILIYIVQTAFSLPGAAILTLAAGFLFGAFLGTVYVNIGATAGATLAFIAARYLFRDSVEKKFGTKLDSIQQGFSKNAFNYLLTLRLIPLFPFFLVNLASGLTRMKLPTYVGGTALGILPGSFVYANAGKQLGTINALEDIASQGVIGAFVLLGLLALVPVVYQKLKRAPMEKQVFDAGDSKK
ncbi:MAG TPA: TVP38/TMEM64 family protein [Nitrospiria bacterium]|jgi:uncharacterized membrane protein YdjX (TVP38/TMEM64 family)